MADGAQQTGDGQASEKEAGEIGRAHEADEAGRKALLRAAQRNQRALQAIARQQVPAVMRSGRSGRRLCMGRDRGIDATIGSNLCERDAAAARRSCASRTGPRALRRGASSPILTPVQSGVLCAEASSSEDREHRSPAKFGASPFPRAPCGA